MTLSKMAERCYAALSVTYAECHIQAFFAECHSAECRYDKCRSAECLGAQNT
jgi:hypothetical protein